MTPDYQDAARRHTEDARTLHDANRWPNADHLYGLGAECGLKAVMVACGMTVDAEGVPEKPYKTHVDRLWPLFHSFASGRVESALANMLPSSNPFWDWDVNQRYANRSDFDPARIAAHQAGADIVIGLLQRAVEMGVVT